MKYKIVTAKTLHELQTHVNEAIADKYEPQGGIMPAPPGVYGLYAQAMIRR